jgi:aspartokinase-like uncharacterized kinase
MIRVIKLGGSLLTLPDWHERFQRWLETESPAINVLLVGGGEMVDVLRREHQRFPYPEKQMHFAALAAMDINAKLAHERLQHACKAESRADIQRLVVMGMAQKNATCLCIVHITSWWRAEFDAQSWMPWKNWDTTSDTLAAWIAGNVTASELVLLKSADPPNRLEAWLAQGYVDANFFSCLRSDIKYRAINFRD